MRVLTTDAGLFMSAVSESIELDVPHLIVPDDVAFSLTTSHRYINGEWILLPQRPSPNHEFDPVTEAWADSRTPETEWPSVRAKRDRLLQESDWTQLPDVPLTTKEAWAAYRQALRDVTLQPDPFNIVWPVAP